LFVTMMARTRARAIALSVSWGFGFGFGCGPSRAEYNRQLDAEASAITTLPVAAAPRLGAATPPSPAAAPPPIEPEQDFNWSRQPRTDCPTPEHRDAGAPPTGEGSDARDAGAIPDAARVIASMRPGFRACWQQVLDASPRREGASIRLSMRVDCTGQIFAIHGVVRGMSSEATDCVFRAALEKHFTPAEGGASTVTVPLIFTVGAPARTY
jgi:hypothetical protein